MDEIWIIDDRCIVFINSLRPEEIIVFLEIQLLTPY